MSVARLQRPGGLGLGLSALGATLALAALWGVVAGPVRLSVGEVARSLWGGPGATEGMADAVVWAIRLPRVGLGILVGASLGVSGALLQGLFRNPLADPGLIGVSSGAALGAALWMLTGGVAALGPAGLPLAAAAGAALAVGAVFWLATLDGRAWAGTLLLAGVALNAGAGAGLGLAQSLADDATLRSLTFWLLGGLGEATGAGLAWVALPLLLPVLLGPRLAPALDAIQLGEAAAGHLGVRVPRLQVGVVALSAVGVGAAVATCGIIGFVGLVVPHLARLVFGPGHRAVLPASALLGAALLVLADGLARVLVAPGELPIGVVTSLLGVPFFAVLLRRARGSFGAGGI